MRIAKISNLMKVTLEFTVPMDFPDDLGAVMSESPGCYFDLKMLSIDRMQVDENLIYWQIQSISSQEI